VAAGPGRPRVTVSALVWDGGARIMSAATEYEEIDVLWLLDRGEVARLEREARAVRFMGEGSVPVRPVQTRWDG
jgi:hypothetical protein